MMNSNSKVNIDPKRLYSAREVAPLLEVTEQTIQRYFRSGELQGRQVGPKKKWHTTGAEIIRKRREWKLDLSRSGN